MYVIIININNNNNNFSRCSLLQAITLLASHKQSKTRVYQKKHTTTARYVIWGGIFFRRKEKKNKQKTIQRPYLRHKPAHSCMNFLASVKKKEQVSMERKEGMNPSLSLFHQGRNR